MFIPADSSQPMAITVALTGAVPMRDRFPSLPVTPEEIGHAADKCSIAGAAAVHVHVRDESGAPVHRRDLYEATYAAIRDLAPELIVCTTTSSRVGGGIEQRTLGMDVDPSLRPELASLSLGSFNFPRTVSHNPPDEIVALLERMGELGIRPEFEVFELGMISTLHALIERGLVPGPPIVNLLLGNAGSAPAHLGDLATMVERLPANTEWAVAGIGAYQRPLTLLAATVGGNVRTGMEDNPRGDGTAGWSNSDATAFAVDAASIAGRRTATSAEMRARFGLVAR
jgi:uncharacterized protein (DUF849 family)